MNFFWRTNKDQQIFISLLVLFLNLSFSFCCFANETMRERIKKYNLPEFCIYTQGWVDSDSVRYDKALKNYGFSWSHMHHFCNGMQFLHIAIFTIGDEKKRDFNFEQAIDQFDYVLKNSEKGFSMTPMVLERKAFVLFNMNKYAEALGNYQIAARLKKEYVPAYSGMSDCFLKLGDKVNAVKILKTGLQYSPKSEVLLKKLSAIQ